MNPVASDGDIPADAVKFEDGRVRVFAPIAPGVKQLSIPLPRADGQGARSRFPCSH